MKTISSNQKTKTTSTNKTIPNLPKKPSSTPKKNDESTSKLPNISDCVLSSTLFP